MLRFIVKYLCSLLLLFGTPVVAADDDPFGITFYGSFLHTDTVPNALFFFNEIEQYDGFELRRALRNHDIDTVVLASDGGNVFEGLNMAGIIHDKGIITYVPELPDDMGCYSACSFMFFGGKIRQADGVLAVHQAGAYGSDRDKAKEKVSETQQSTQFTVSEIIGFLNEFETPPWVYEKMFRSREFYEFDQEEKQRLASRTDKIDPQSLYSINGFINAFFKHLDKLEEQKKKSAVPKEPELSEEEELKLLVMQVQKLLNAAGCNAGVADGIWGRRTQAAAVLFAKTAKLPTSKNDLISEKFIERLRAAPAAFCPKPVKRRAEKKSTLTGWWKSSDSCSKHGRSFKMIYQSRDGQTTIYDTKPYFVVIQHIHAGGRDELKVGSRSGFKRVKNIGGRVYRRYRSGGCYSQMKKIG